MDNPERIRNLTVIQDFNNKRANAHAAMFVASMFALFTVLSLAQRTVINDHLILNPWILFLPIASYWIIWFFGLYCLGNFTYYSTVAQRAENEIIGNMEHDLISQYIPLWKGLFKSFASFKINENRDRILRFIRSHNEFLSIFVYSLIGILPFIAFIIWLG
jgi:hypothetical protein